MIPIALETLHKHFGYSSFRHNQEAIIANVLDGKDTFVLMPTGGGKSLCYQLPALVFEGVTLVISPLIALMKDQVDALRVNGIQAASLNSTLAYQDQQNIVQLLRENKLKLLYLAPERLLKTENEFISFLKQVKVSLIAIDEAHCISQWGHDFRPEYRMLERLKQEFPDTPVIALTATADKLTQKDILEKLALHNPGIFISSFNRPNIKYRVEPKQRSFDRLLDFLETRPDDSGIIYCLSRSSTEDLARQLTAEGYKALPYHAGLEKEVRSQNQELFLRDEVRIIVATIAFGMGINKSNVRYIVHMDLPKSIEGYYQETGRAGRDGLDSEALLFYSYADVNKLRNFATIESNDKQTGINLQKLDKMALYGEIKTCRRKYLLNYFDEPAPDDCGNCDICLSDFETFDGTVIAQKALSAVARLQERFGIGYVIDFLRGSASEKIREEHKHLKTYGVGADITKEEWQKHFYDLLGQGYLKKSDGQYPVLQLTEMSHPVLKGQEKVTLASVKAKAVVAPVPAQEEQPHEDELFTKLKRVRLDLARLEDVPAYIVLSDATLLELATYLPHNREEISRISGFGEVKLDKYSEHFVNAIVEYCQLKGLSSRIHLRQSKRIRKDKREKLSDTKQQSLDLFLKGRNLSQIASERALSIGTIESHLAYFVETGDLDVLQLITADKYKKIEEIAAIKGYTSLAPIKETLGDAVSYGDIRMVLSDVKRKQKMEEAK